LERSSYNPVVDSEAITSGLMDRRGRLKELVARNLPQGITSPADAWEQARFVARARALFFARMMFLTLGLLILAVPVWAQYFGLTGPAAAIAYFTMLLYSVANLLVINHATAGRYVTYITLCLDLVFMVILVAKPQVGGGLQSPLLATQLLFTMLFAILFPKPLAILPPMLALPITTRLDLLLHGNVAAIDVLTLLWYSALNFIIVYVIVYLNEREAASHREVLQLQADLKELAVLEERNRIAREIHDGLGASLSSLIIQAEYLQGIAPLDAPLQQEITELRASAEEAIEELRRNLRMMRDDFELDPALEEHVRTFGERVQLPIAFQRAGLPQRLNPDVQLALFRILQEALSNAARHGGAGQVRVRLGYELGQVSLSVRDDGRGFDVQQARSGHYGLLNMHERAQKIGGTLLVESAPGQGTHVCLTVPVHS
jgi:two-component system, NarL family, sensor histidine kinase DegS